MNWRAGFWGFVFSFVWAALLGLFGLGFALSVFLGVLLGFLTLCATDVWQAYRHHLALRDELRRKRRQAEGKQP